MSAFTLSIKVQKHHMGNVPSIPLAVIFPWLHIFKLLSSVDWRLRYHSHLRSHIWLKQQHGISFFIFVVEQQNLKLLAMCFLFHSMMSACSSPWMIWDKSFCSCLQFTHTDCWVNSDHQRSDAWNTINWNFWHNRLSILLCVGVCACTPSGGLMSHLFKVQRKFPALHGITFIDYHQNQKGWVWQSIVRWETCM